MTRHQSRPRREALLAISTAERRCPPRGRARRLAADVDARHRQTGSESAIRCPPPYESIRRAERRARRAHAKSVDRNSVAVAIAKFVRRVRERLTDERQSRRPARSRRREESPRVQRRAVARHDADMNVSQRSEQWLTMTSPMGPRSTTSFRNKSIKFSSPPICQNAARLHRSRA